MSIPYTPGTPMTVVDTIQTPEDTIDFVESASVVPAFEGIADNAMLAIQQLRPGLTRAQIAAIPAPPNGAVRLLGQDTDARVGVTLMVFMAGTFGTEPWYVEGLTYITASDMSGTWYDFQAGGVGLSGTVPRTVDNNALGIFTFGAQQPLSTPTFLTPQRSTVNIPVHTMYPAIPGSSTAQQIDNVYFAIEYPGIVAFGQGLPGIRALGTLTPSTPAAFTFRTRLPRGLFQGIEVVAKPNSSGITSTTTNAAVSLPMAINIYEVKTTAVSGGYPGNNPATYSTASLQTDALTLVWTGSCGVAGNNIGTTSGTGSGAHWIDDRIRSMPFMSGTTNTSSDTCGGGAAFNTSEDKDYMVVVNWPTFTGSNYASTWAAGLKPVLYKLTAFLDVTGLSKA